MEPTYREPLSRDDITSILNERHLKIPSIEKLPYGELLRIYKAFAVPLEKRECRRLIVTSVSVPDLQPFTVPPNMARPFAQDLIAHTVILNEHVNAHHDPHLLQQTKYLKLSFNTIANTAKKRPSSSGINGVQEATPAKRQPITWP